MVRSKCLCFSRPNLNPYILLDWDADTFAAARTLGGVGSDNEPNGIEVTKGRRLITTASVDTSSGPGAVGRGAL